MKFNDYKYEKINIDETKEKFSNLIKSFSDAENLEEQTKYMDEIIKLRNHIDTMETLVSIKKMNMCMKFHLFYLDLFLNFTKH